MIPNEITKANTKVLAHKQSRTSSFILAAEQIANAEQITNAEKIECKAGLDAEQIESVGAR